VSLLRPLNGAPPQAPAAICARHRTPFTDGPHPPRYARLPLPHCGRGGVCDVLGRLVRRWPP